MKLLLIAFIFYSSVNALPLPKDSTSNILQNGGFETTTKDIPDGWKGDPSIYSIDNLSFAGKYSLKYSNSDTSVYRLCSQVTNAKPGVIYSAGVKTKTKDITGEDSGASFCIEWLDSKGNWLGGNYPKGIKGTNDWTEISSNIFIPENAVKVVFSCYVRKAMIGKAWFDDAYMIPFESLKSAITVDKPAYRGMLIEESDENISIKLNLNNFSRDLKDSELQTILSDSLGKQLYSKNIKLTGNNFNNEIQFCAKTLTAGKYNINIRLIDDHDQLIDSTKIKIEKFLTGGYPAVYIDNNKRLIVNGKAKFPLGMYWSKINEDDLNIYSQSKFYFILPYSPPNEDMMNLVEKYKLKVIYSVKDYYAGMKYTPSEIQTRSDEYIILKNTIENFREHPALLAWYNNDEFEPSFIDRLTEHYNMIINLDKNHPVLSIILNPNETNLFLSSTDVIGSDPYVVPKLPLSTVGTHTSIVINKSNNDRPVWMVIQAHDLGNYADIVKKPEEYRAPTYSEMRNMAWQAICEGANGLIFYSFFDLKINKGMSFNDQWSNLKNIAEEIDSYSDILLSTEVTEQVKVQPIIDDNKWLNFRTFKYQESLYVFLVNNGSDEKEFKIQLPPGYSKIHLVNGSTEDIKVSNTEIHDIIKPFDLKIYCFE